MDSRPRSAGLRVLQPQHSREQRHRLHHLPRPGGPHAADVAGAVAADGVVPRLPPESGTIRAAARRGLQRRLRPATQPARAREAAGGRVSHSEAHELLDMPPMSEETRRGLGLGARTQEPSRGSGLGARTQKPGRDSGLGARDLGEEQLAPSPQPLAGSGFWRTLEERAEDPAFQEHLYNEFPSEIEAITDPVARRTFLKLMGASMALAGATACTRQPPEKIVPYVRQPEELIPGRPLFYATAMPLGGVATGLLVESHEGRPTTVEGNPLHPGSLGATDVFAQAAILGLYDPDRSQTLTNLGEIRPWSSFLGAINAALTAQKPLKGAGLRILTESVNSPTLAAQIRDLLARFPSAKWHQWDPASRDTARVGAKLAFTGEYVDAQYRFEQADVILSLDADFLGSGPGGLRYAREFAARRRPENAALMNRLYVVES